MEQIKHLLPRLFFASVLLLHSALSASEENISFRTQYDNWLHKQNFSSSDIARARYSQGVLSLRCHLPIEFSFSNERRRQVKAVCKDEWRRFIRTPPKRMRDEKFGVRAKAKSRPTPLFIASQDIEFGELVTKNMLELVTDRVAIPANAFRQSDLVEKLYAQRPIKQGTTIISSDLSQPARVLVASSEISAGTPIRPSQFSAKLLTVGIPKDAVISTDAIRFMESNKRIGTGEVLRQRDMRKTKLVRRNESVTIIRKKSNFAITAQGVALRDGYFGGRVTAKNLESNRVVTGFVTDFGELTLKDL